MIYSFRPKFVMKMHWPQTRPDMIRKKRSLSLDNLKLSNPQKAAVARLLTAQKNKYKKLLHETHERMHIIADLTTSLEFWYNVNGSYEYVGRSSEQILGYLPEDFTRGNMRLETLIHPDSIEEFRKDRANALEGESGENVEYRLFTADKKVKWVQATWNPILTRKGKHIGIRISIRDISEFKQCQAFSRSYERLSLTIANELEEAGIFSVTADMVLKSWNIGANKLLGWEREEMIDAPVSKLFGDDAEKHFDAARSMDCGEEYRAEFVLLSKDGEPRSVRMLFLNLCNHEADLYQLTCMFRSAE
ncbi:MAG: hypothetical protein C0600_10120 [Ignavibacteria bacterium]|nr:MAG: hypothetical protein C0600_10120 [Ignavibacteria bacterium]